MEHLQHLISLNEDSCRYEWLHEYLFERSSDQPKFV